MSFSSINIQGNIVSSEILDKIRTEEKFKHQSPEAFGLARTASLRDEIGHAWAIMRVHWQAYKRRLESLPANDTGTSLTRERLIIPLLAELGYETSRQNAQMVNGKSYAISHGAANRDLYPIHIMGYKDHLDKRRDSGGPRLSPHALVQEYLNNTEHLYALVTNGKQLRLLRDATRLVRMSYLEFDLQRMFEEELYADFSILYRVLHASRMPEQMDSGPDSVIEFYHQESMASGTRIREKLSEAVEDSIKTLANGFLTHRKNELLTALVEKKQISADEYYTYQLRLIYRILFLIVLEERKIIFPDDISEEEQRFRSIYYKYYSIERLRKLAENRVYVDADKYDLWESLKTTFLLFEEEQYGSKIGIKPLGSGLFAPNALGNLKEQFLSNGDLIEVLKRLTTFVSEQGQLVRVNYSDLDVEEFGSVYEGLLEYDPVIEKIGAKWQFSFVVGDGRSSSGSHYTPEELVKPLIKHSLDYIIADKLKVPTDVIASEAKQSLQEEQLLSITVCDVACGSGHILLSAARKIATELASIREGAEQPSPTYYRAAIRDVIRNCIYGVDLNPLAVELCKVALWLEAHNPNEPLNFLDHHIKNGNAIVGLAHFEELQNGIANEAFKALPGDDKTLASELKKKNTLEKQTAGQLSTYNIAEVDDSLKGLQKDFAQFVTMPENTPEQIEAKTKAYQDLTTGKKWYRLKNLADLQVAQFFIPKTIENKEKLTTEAKYRTYLNAGTQILDRGAAMAMAAEKHFFHWFLEFPQVFSNGGFDCILGNPPYLGGTKISTNYGESMQHYLTNQGPKVSGHADLVSYFFRRSSIIINNFGFFSFITTNSISQGDTREYALEGLLKNGLIINFCVPSMIWPGKAEVHVSIIALSSKIKIPKYIRSELVENISSYLSDEEFLPSAIQLDSNSDLGFLGHYVNGTGFMLSIEEGKSLLLEDAIYQSVVKPYINGKGLNSSPLLEANRYVIYFDEMTEEDASFYKTPFQIIKERVYPERIKKDAKKYPRMVFEWWKFWNNRQKLTSELSKSSHAIAIARVSKTVAFAIVEKDQVFDEKLIVIPSNNPYYAFTCLQNSIHNVWAWKYCTTMKADLTYTPDTILATYAFPPKSEKLVAVGRLYHKTRSEAMISLKIGLTKLYNLFHDKGFLEENGVNTLREIHKEMDEAVLAAYGWQDIQLRHDFYEVDYLPENDRLRYTIHPEARKEVLKRLLLLNHERFEEEVAKGLHKKKDVVAYFEQKGKPVPVGTEFSDGKKKSTKAKAPKKKNKDQGELGL